VLWSAELAHNLWGLGTFLGGAPQCCGGKELSSTEKLKKHGCLARLAVDIIEVKSRENKKCANAEKTCVGKRQ